MTDSQKLDAIQEMCGMSWRMLAKKIGIPTSQRFSDIRAGRHNISADLANKILDAFPQIRREWLLLGEGEMLSDAAPQSPTLRTPDGKEYESAVIKPVAGCGIEVIFPLVEGAFRYNDSNMAEYPKGAVLMVRRITDTAMIIPGHNYLVETADGATVNRIQRGSDDRHMALYSTNDAKYPDGRPVFEPYEIPSDAVLGVYKVIGYVESIGADI